MWGQKKNNKQMTKFLRSALPNYIFLEEIQQVLAKKIINLKG